LHALPNYFGGGEDAPRGVNMQILTSDGEMDLGEVGVTEQTTFEIDIEIDPDNGSFSPQTVVAIGTEATVISRSAGDPATVTLEVRPTAGAINRNVQVDEPADWPERNVTATFDADAVLILNVVEVGGSEVDEMQGVTITTNAQMFSPPQYQPPEGNSAPQIVVDLAAPHFRTDGSTVNTGKFKAFLPDRLLNSWGVTDPSRLTVTAPTSGGTLSITEVSNGVRVELTGYHYSSGSAVISVNDSADTPNGTDDRANNQPGPSGSPPARFAAFQATRSLGGNQAEPASLAGKLRVESMFHDATEVTLTTNISTEYTLNLTVTAANATNVTFYLQQQAVEALQDIDNVTMYLDDERRNFYVDQKAGAGNSPWIAFEVDHFSTRTVSFVAENDTQSPTPAFAISPEQPTVNESVTFDASDASDPDGSIESYEWDFDGDGTTDATGEVVSHAFATAGDHAVTLTVTDDQGATNSTTQTVTVTDPSTRPSERTVSLTPKTHTTATNTTVTYEITLTAAVGGVGAFSNLTVDVSDPAVAELTAISTDVSAGANSGVYAGGASAYVNVPFGGDTADSGTVTLATVEVRANATGTVTLNLTITGDIAMENGTLYQIDTVADGTLTVTSGPDVPAVVGSDPPRNTDDDPQLEDVNGNERLDIGDVQALFANRNGDAIKNNVDAFDFNGNDRIDIGDIQALFSELRAG